MNPRYFVTYKHYNGQRTELLTVSIGRFNDRERAETRARELYEKAGNEITQIRQETSGEAAWNKFLRLCIRSLRVVLGAALGISAYAFVYDPDLNIGDVPFSSLTLNMILSALFRAALLIGAAVLCWHTAFGPGPKE